MRLEFETQRIEFLKKLNEEFTLVKIYAMGIGKNRNFTYISKEDTEKAIPSAYYCPVVGHIRVYVDADGVEHEYMGGHDFEITDDWELKVVTRPYGVIVENSEGWETVNEHGTDVEYLTFDAILWTGRYPELKDAFYSDDILFGQSMEINIENYRPLEEDSNYWEVLGYTFSAFCLLGKADEDSTNGHTNKEVEHTEPAFISSKVVPYEFNYDEFKQEFTLLKDKINDLINNFEINYDKVVSFVEDATINEEKGGKSMAETEKTVETAVAYEVGESAETEAVEDVVEVTTEEKAEESTADEFADDTTEEETAGEEPVEDATDYQAKYNESVTAYEALKKEFEDYKSTHSYDNESYNALMQYKCDREKADREKAESALFSSFEDRIGDTDEYKALSDNCADYSLEDIELRLYAIVGRHSKVNQTDEKKPEIMKFSLGDVNETETAKDPYGNAREYYL